MNRLLALASFASACLLAAACSSKNNNNRATETTPLPHAQTLATATPGPVPASPTVASSAVTPSAATPSPGSESASPTPATAAATVVATSTVAPSATTTPPAPAQTAAPAASAQTAAPSPTATAAPSAASGAGNGVDPNTLLDAIKLTSADLPAGFSLGALTSTEQNAQAVDGFDDPQSALSLMNSTGRQIGLVQQVSTPDSSSGAGISIEVWQDDTGAKAWMDSYPAPESDLSPQRLTPPQTVGDQTILYRFNQNGTIIYSMTWRRGRVVLGVGEPFGSDAGAIEKLMQLVNILDAKAVAALKGG